jgi:CRP-like cAMP-binding protein
MTPWGTDIPANRYRRSVVRFRGCVMTAIPPPSTLLSALPTDLLHSLFAEGRNISLIAEQILFCAGDEGDGCYLVDEGLLKASMVAPTGSERILAIFGPGSVVGELSMIDGVRRSASIEALRDSKVRFISRVHFEAFGRARPELYRHLTTLLAHRLRETNEVLAATSFLSVKGRVVRALLNLAEAFGGDVGQRRILIRQKISQRDLAAMAGIARENVNRVLQDLTSRLLVSNLAGYYCLENSDALKRETEEDLVADAHTSLSQSAVRLETKVISIQSPLRSGRAAVEQS